MITENIKINKGQWLGEVLKEIGTNAILNKTITGIGATTLEINTPRHSIIIEPNVPVITGKEKKHKFIRGVYEGITAKMIEKYLAENKGHFKIMTTPESFSKVKRAIKNIGMNLYKDFFILFDECEKIIQDVDYRKKISLPLNDFFKSNHKAMVSATPIIPSDPRFEEQKFSLIKIVPNFEYSRRMILYPTNNVQVTLKMSLQTLKEMDAKGEDKYCLFFNSTNGIEDFISFLDIKKDTNIYCSTDSKEKLKSHGYKSVYDCLESDKDVIEFNKYNFFTSRFYSAVDIELPYKPNVIMVTDLFTAFHSMIDPETEAIQIAGRFRKGIKNLVHITNYDKKLEYKTPEMLAVYLEGQHNIYMEFLKMFQSAKDSGEKHILQQALDCVDYSRFVTMNGEKDYFMYDNAFRDEYLKSIYTHPRSIEKSFNNSGKFNIIYRFIQSALSDADRKAIRNKNINQSDLNKITYNFIKNHLKTKKDYDKEYIKSLGKSHELISEALTVLGEKELLKIGFKDADIKRNIANKKTDSKNRSRGVITAVHNAFQENTWYSTSEINSHLMKIYKAFDLTIDKRGIAPKITLYFNAKINNKDHAKGWMLAERIY